METDKDKLTMEILVDFSVAAKDLSSNIKKLNDEFALHQRQCDKIEIGVNKTISMYSKVIATLGTLLLIAVGGAAVLEKFFNLK